jgi:hypothetical protein
MVSGTPGNTRSLANTSDVARRNVVKTSSGKSKTVMCVGAMQESWAACGLMHLISQGLAAASLASTGIELAALSCTHHVAKERKCAQEVRAISNWVFT